MSSIGYYRYKTIPLTEGLTEVKFYKNGALDLTCKIIAKKMCGDYKILKYLDKDGKYRFFPFNQYYSKQDAPKQIGSVNKIIESILYSQSDSNNVGYTNARTLTLIAENVSTDEMTILSDLFLSPSVYLYIGDGGNNDELTDWLMVTVKGDGILKSGKSKNRKVTVEVSLPEFYSQTLK